MGPGRQPRSMIRHTSPRFAAPISDNHAAVTLNREITFHRH
jgi:hypothetical protein